MTTTEFKALYNLSQSGFTRLVNRIMTKHGVTREELIKREGSTNYTILRLDLFEAEMKDRPAQPTASEAQSTSRWAIVPRQTAEIQVQDERTGEWLDVYSETTAVQIDESKANVSEAREAMQLLDIQAQSIRSATQASELQAMQDELNRYRLMAKYKKLMKAKIDAEESNTPFTLGNELDRIATALGV